MKSVHAPNVLFGLVVCVLVAAPSPSAAFLYPEHVAFTDRGLAYVTANEPALRKVFTAVSKVIDDKLLCTAGLLDGPRKKACFKLADFPALAADHAATPADIVGRWFRGEKAAESGRTLKNVTDALFADPNKDTPAAACEPSLPHIADFLKVVRDYDMGRGSKSPEGLDEWLVDADGDYLCLALHNRSHFRVPEVAPRDAARMPTDNVFSWYMDFHTKALVFASLAAAEKDPTRVATWRGVAMLFESFAVHFVQDAVASGHMVTLYGNMSHATIKATHDYYSNRGILVMVPTPLCTRLATLKKPAAFPALQAVCRKRSAKSRLAVLRGDGALMRGVKAGSMPDITADIASFVTMLSLMDVARAAVGLDDPNIDVGDACLALVRACAAGPSRSATRPCQEVWAKPACEATRARRVAGASVRGRSGELLKVFPMTAEQTPAQRFYSGTGLLLSNLTRWGFAAPDSVHMSDFMNSALGIGVAWYSPPVGTMRFSLGAELLIDVTEGRDDRGAVPSLLGLRTWLTLNYALDYTVYATVGMVTDLLRVDEERFWDIKGVALGWFAVPIGFSLNTFDDAAVRIGPGIGMMFPVAFDGPSDWSWYVGLELVLALHSQ